jgi:hypothetical protein
MLLAPQRAIDFEAKIAKSRAKLDELKKADPESFPAYRRLKIAEKKLILARGELRAARQAWKEF